MNFSPTDNSILDSDFFDDGFQSPLDQVDLVDQILSGDFLVNDTNVSSQLNEFFLPDQSVTYRIHTPIETNVSENQQYSDRLIDDNFGDYFLDSNLLLDDLCVEEKKEKEKDFDTELESMFDRDFHSKIISSETSKEDIAIINQIANELKSIRIPLIDTIEKSPALPESSKFGNSSETDLCGLRKPGRPKHSPTDPNSQFIKVGNKQVLRNSQEHHEHLIRTRENVRRCREKKKANRSVKRLDNDVKCSYCDNYFTKRGIKTHEEKCPSKDLKVKCNKCNQTFKKFGIKNHQKTCFTIDSSSLSSSCSSSENSTDQSSLSFDLNNIIDLSLLS